MHNGRGWPQRHPINGQFTLNRRSPQWPGLLAAFPADPSRSSKLYDRGGRVSPGSLSNGIAWASDAEHGSVLSLDGTDDYVDFGGTTTLGLTGDTGYTFSVWVNPSALRNDGSWLSYGNGPNNTVIAVTTNGTVFRVVHWANDNNFTTAPTLNVWQLVALSYDPSTSTETLYVNGIARETWTPANLAINTNETLTIGRASWAGSYAHTCKIGEARVYDRPLAPAVHYDMWHPETRRNLWEPVRTPVRYGVIIPGQPTALRQSQQLTGVRRWGRGF